MGSGRLFRKYALVIALLVAGSLIVSGGVELFFSYQETQTALGQVQREKAAAAATRIGQFVREMDQHLASALQPSHAVGAVDLDVVRRDYLRILRQGEAITELEYIDASGRQQLRIRRTESDLIGSRADRQAEPGFFEARARRVAAERSYYSPVTFRDGTQPYLSIARADEGQAGGVHIAVVNLKFIYDIVAEIRVGRTGRAYLVDSSGALIAHPDLALALGRRDLSALPQVRQAISREAEEAMVAPAIDGTQVLTAYQRVERVGWTVFVEQPLAEAFAPLYASALRTVALVVLGLLVALAASLILARRMVRPIHALQASAARVAAGELDHRIDLRTGDELEDLAREFDHMTVQLRDSYATLEERVEQRTRELASANDELDQRSLQLEQASRHKSEFLANMSHELRTPLNAIIGFSEVLTQGMAGELNEKQREYLQDVLASGRHLLELINEILDLSKVEAGRMQLELSTFSLAELLTNAVNLFRERAGRKRIALTLELSDGLDEISADQRKVKQVMLNLFSNAVKFTPEGGTIAVAARRVADEVEVAVRDTGVGIPPDELERVFEPFGQGAQGRAAEEGTGLGLALCRRFVELHGGRIEVESVPGKGSTFSFTLPLRDAVPSAT